MNRFLFPTDFSTLSKDVFTYTQNFAQNFNAEITVLHAHTIQDDLRTLFVPGRDIWTQLSNFVQDEADEIPSNVSMLVRKGKTVDEVLQLAANQQYRYIVMGKKKAYGMYRRWKGSKTVRVARRAERPVMIVPENAQYRPIRNILVIDANYQSLTSAIQEHLLALSLRFNANLHYLDIVDEGIQWGGRQQPLHHNQVLIQKRVPKDLATEIVDEYIPEKNIDLVVMLSRRKELFLHVFRQNFHSADGTPIDIPLLVFNKRCQRMLEKAATPERVTQESVIALPETGSPPMRLSS